MNRPLLFLFVGLFIANLATGQSCPEYDNLIKAGDYYHSNEKAKDYRKALNKYNAAKLCDPAKASEVDQRINALFTAIDEEKREAVRQKTEADRQRAIARQQANEAKALYWASESDKLEPVQAVRLLKSALKLAPDVLPVQERLLRRVNEIPAEAGPIGPRLGAFYNSPASFSPDRKKILTAAFQDSVVIWNATRYDKPTAIFRQRGRITHASLSPDGTRLLISSGDTSAVSTLWALKAPNLALAEFSHKRRVVSSAFSPDGQRVLLSENHDSTATLWNLADLKTHSARFRHESHVIAARFSPDGKWIFSTCAQSPVLWKANEPHQPVHVFNWSTSGLTAVFSPDGQHLITFRSNTAELWNLSSFEKPVAVLPNVELACFSPNGKQLMLASASGSGPVRFGNVNQLNADLKRFDQGTYSSEIATSVLMSGGLAFTSYRNGVCVNDVKVPDKALMTLSQQNLESVAVSPDAGRALTIGSGGMRVWHLRFDSALEWLKANDDLLAPLSEENRLKYGVPK